LAPFLPYLGFLAALVITFVYRQRFRSAFQRAAVWLKSEGDGFIFHPFGKWGRAYQVSSAAAGLIKARLTIRTKILYSALLAAIVPSLIVAAIDPADFIELRPYLSLARAGIVAIALLAIWVWQHVAIRPLYANAPVSSLRILPQEVRMKRALNTSWGTILFTFIRLGLLAGALCWYGVSTHRPIILAISALLVIRAITTIRIIHFKLQT
jgi:hypothetical protein